MFAASWSGRVRGVVLAVVALVALLGSLLVVVSRPAPAQAVVTGSGGQYVPMPSNARVLGGATEKGVFRAIIAPEAAVFDAIGTALLGCASGVAIYQANESGNAFAANTINDLDIASNYYALLQRFFL